MMETQRSKHISKGQEKLHVYKVLIREQLKITHKNIQRKSANLSANGFRCFYSYLKEMRYY